MIFDSLGVELTFIMGTVIVTFLFHSFACFKEGIGQILSLSFSTLSCLPCRDFCGFCIIFLYLRFAVEIEMIIASVI